MEPIIPTWVFYVFFVLSETKIALLFVFKWIVAIIGVAATLAIVLIPLWIDLADENDDINGSINFIKSI